MAVSQTPDDIAARDDAHLRSLGIQPRSVSAYAQQVVG